MNNKKIIFQVTKTYMKMNRRRTAITFAGILVMVVLMTAVFIGKDTVMRFVQDAVEEDRGSWHAQVYQVDEEQVEAIKSLDYVDQVAVTRPLGYTEFEQSGNPDATPFLELKGYSPEVFEWLKIRVKEGRLPEAEDELILSERAISEGSGIQIGDTIKVDAFKRYVHAFAKGEDDEGFVMFSPTFIVKHGDTVEAPDHFANFTNNEDFEMINKPTGFTKTYKVVGIMESPNYEAAGQGGYIALVPTEPVVAAGETVNVVLTVDLHKKAQISYDLNNIVNASRTEEEMELLKEEGTSVISASGEHIPVEEGRVVVNNMLLTFAAKGTDGTFNLMLIFFQVFFIVLITTASLVLIYNVFNISYNERSRYLGMLASVGATRAQKRWSVYYEVLILLAAALPCGILLGLLVIKGGMALLYPHFSTLLGMIAENVISGRSTQIGYHLVINPVNVLFVILFSVMAVWVSAVIPAAKISKVQPIESIRGTDDKKAKPCRTNFRLMEMGHPEALLSSANVKRNRYATKGIVRSITAFIVLTLVTAYASGTFSDIVEQKTNNRDVVYGSAFEGYKFAFGTEDEAMYAQYKEEIETSDEVSGFKELHYELFADNIFLESLSDTYNDSLEKLVGKFFPQGIPEEIRKIYLEPEYVTNNPTLNKLVLTDEDFAAVAKKAGVSADPAAKEPQIMVYDTVELSTDDLRIEFAGAIKPDYARYQFKNPLRCEPGEQPGIFRYDYDEDKQIDLPVIFAGYVSADDLKDLYELKDGEIWMIISETGEEKLESLLPVQGPGIVDHTVLFNTYEADSAIVRKLSNITDELGNGVLYSATMYSGMTDFKGAISKIVKIVAICFTLLVAVISLLNLYNSVMGRKIARQKELAVLRSIGITEGQTRKMLTLENIRLLARSLVYSGLITAAFVVLLHAVVSMRFGRLLFHAPIGIVIIVLLVSVASLMAFTYVCYREDAAQTLIEEVRREVV